MSLPSDSSGAMPGETNENALELREVEGLSQGQIVRKRFFRHRGALAGMTALVLVALLAFTSIGAFGIPGWWRFDPVRTTDVLNSGRPTLGMPTWLGGEGLAWGQHPFGQDEIGRDVFARTMKGTQTSLMVMFVVSGIAMVIGMVVGALSGYYRGGVDQGLMRLTDLFLTFPLIVIGAVLGNLAGGQGVFWLAVVLGLVTWPTLARLVRGEFLSLREREFVDAARVAGASDVRIMRKHMIPNAIGVIIVNTTLLASAAVLLEAALSYLGFGVRSPDVSLGTMISDYQEAFSTRPNLFWWPGLFIIVIALSANFIGDGLRDAFDPRQKRIPSEREMRKALLRDSAPVAAHAGGEPGPSADGGTDSGSSDRGPEGTGR